MKDRVTQQELATPHFVEWVVFKDGEKSPYQYFADREEAISFYETQDRRGYTVWLGEVGIYQTAQGNSIRDWVYYMWNPKAVENWDWGKPTGRRLGYPAQAQSQLVDYQPYDSRQLKFGG